MLPPSPTLPRPRCSQVRYNTLLIPHKKLKMLLCQLKDTKRLYNHSFFAFIFSSFCVFQSVSTSTSRPTLVPIWTGRRYSSFLITSGPTDPQWCCSRPFKAASTALSSRKRCSLSSHKATGEKKYQVLYKEPPQVLLSVCLIASLALSLRCY